MLFECGVKVRYTPELLEEVNNRLKFDGVQVNINCKRIEVYFHSNNIYDDFNERRKSIVEFYNDYSGKVDYYIGIIDGNKFAELNGVFYEDLDYSLFDFLEVYRDIFTDDDTIFKTSLMDFICEIDYFPKEVNEHYKLVSLYKDFQNNKYSKYTFLILPFLTRKRPSREETKKILEVADEESFRLMIMNEDYFNILEWFKTYFDTSLIINKIENIFIENGYFEYTKNVDLLDGYCKKNGFKFSTFASQLNPDLIIGSEKNIKKVKMIQNLMYE